MSAEEMCKSVPFILNWQITFDIMQLFPAEPAVGQTPMPTFLQLMAHNLQLSPEKEITIPTIVLCFPKILCPLLNTVENVYTSNKYL